jgi:hypothetical protein
VDAVPRLQRLGAPDPARHAEGAKFLERDLQERHCAVAVTRRGATRVHERFVVVDDRAQRTCALLVENGAGLGKPVGRFVVAVLQRAEPGDSEAPVHHGVVVLGRDDLVAKVTLDDVDPVGALGEPQRLGGVTRDPGVVLRPSWCSVDRG